MKKICAFLIILLSATLLCSCGSKKTSNFDVNIEEINVDLNAASEFKILYLSDLHISVLNDEVASADEATVSQRILDYTYEGNTSVDTWKQWITYINDQSPDLVLFGADMLDFCSIENIQILEEGLKQLQVPYVYIRADHDSEPFYLADTDIDRAHQRQSELDELGATDMSYQEYDHMVILSWNNSTNQLTEAGLNIAREAAAIGKPMILLTHVPIQSLVDDTLGSSSKEHWQDRMLLWGKDCYYYPDGNTQELLNMIYAEDSLFQEILCGHLHYTWDGMVTNRVHEHVFSPAFSHNVGWITIH